MTERRVKSGFRSLAPRSLVSFSPHASEATPVLSSWICIEAHTNSLERFGRPDTLVTTSMLDRQLRRKVPFCRRMNNSYPSIRVLGLTELCLWCLNLFASPAGKKVKFNIQYFFLCNYFYLKNITLIKTSFMMTATMPGPFLLVSYLTISTMGRRCRTSCCEPPTVTSNSRSFTSKKQIMMIHARPNCFYPIALFAALLLVLPIAVVDSLSYSIQLPPSHKECYELHALPRPHTLRGDYEVLNDEDIDTNEIRVSLYEKYNHTEIWVSNPELDEEIFAVSVDPGLSFLLCFESLIDNDSNDPRKIHVGFNVRLHNIPVRASMKPEEKGPDTEMALTLIERAYDIEDSWESLLAHFDYLRQREGSHERLTKQILARLLSWSLIEAALVVTMATCQVMYWKKFFEQRRYL